MEIAIDYLTPALVTIFGLCIGSFLNVVIYRLPNDLSIVSPGSFCPSCRRSLTLRDLFPLVSYLVNRGRCRHCGETISIWYPIVELTTAMLFLFHFEMYYEAQGMGTEFITRTIFVVFVLMMAFIDARHFIIPDSLSLGGLAAGLVLSFLPGDMSPQGAFFGAIVGGGFLLAGSIVGEWVMKKEAMGMGDVKMIAMIGSFTGWEGILITIFLGSLLGVLIFGPLNIRRRRLIPFGVFLAIGGIMTIYMRDPIIHFYLSTFWK